MPTTIDLRGKIAIVTGGSRGIGKAISHALAYAGTTILVLDKVVDDTAKAELKRISAQNNILYANTTESASLEQAREQILLAYGTIDILVNNAGIVKVGAFEKTSLTDIRELFETNVFGTMNATQIFGEVMLKNKKGKVINIVSTDAQVSTTGHDSELGVEYVVPYAASKGAILSFTKALAVEWGKNNITVNGISPILVETPMTKHLFEDAARCAAYQQGLPLGKNPAMKDIGNAAVYLASSLADCVTGHILNVDCGYLARSMREI